jgi:hypothetical protein
LLSANPIFFGVASGFNPDNGSGLIPLSAQPNIQSGLTGGGQPLPTLSPFISLYGIIKI